MLISPTFDFDFFVEAVKDLHQPEIINKAQEEIAAVEAISTGGVKGAPAARKAGSVRYTALLGGLIYLLSQKQRPFGLDS